MLAGPWRHRRCDDLQWARCARAELKARAGRAIHLHVRPEANDLLAVIVSEPHLPPSRDGMPDLFDGTVHDGVGCCASRELEVIHLAVSAAGPIQTAEPSGDKASAARTGLTAITISPERSPMSRGVCWGFRRRTS